MHLRCHTGPPGNLGMKDSKNSMVTTQERGSSQGFEQTAWGSVPSEKPDSSVSCTILQKESLKILKC